jgi:hypothetical protein
MVEVPALMGSRPKAVNETGGESTSRGAERFQITRDSPTLQTRDAEAAESARD